MPVPYCCASCRSAARSEPGMSPASPTSARESEPGAAWKGHSRERMYRPMVAGVAQTGDLPDARLRAGNAHTAEGALDFILDLVDRIETTMCQVAPVRLDAGFPDETRL